MLKRFLIPHYGWGWPSEVLLIASDATVLPLLAGLILGLGITNAVSMLASWLWLIPVYAVSYYITAVAYEVHDYNGSTIATYIIAISAGWHLGPALYIILLLVDKYHLIEYFNYFFN